MFYMFRGSVAEGGGRSNNSTKIR